MGLSTVVATSAARHAHVLLVEVPGCSRTRIAAEDAVLERGWQLAVSPSDADVLLVCGEPGPGMAGAIETVWHQLPGPRVRVDAHAGEQVSARLEEAHARLLDSAHHRHDAQERPTAAGLLAAQADSGHQGPGDLDHGGHEDVDHEGHEGHGDMEMAPGGIPLAEGGEDRDGLEMDVLHVRLGPALPHWPAGLVVSCSLQGDVIVAARAELLDPGARRADEAPLAVRRLDQVASLLALAGWAHAANETRSMRDTALRTGTAPAGPRVDRWRRRVRRSWTLRWSLRGVGPVGGEQLWGQGLPADAAGDTYDRLLRMLDRAADATQDQGPALSVAQLPDLLTGLDVATARLVLASLDLHQLLTGLVEHEVSHG